MTKFGVTNLSSLPAVSIALSFASPSTQASRIGTEINDPSQLAKAAPGQTYISLQLRLQHIQALANAVCGPASPASRPPSPTLARRFCETSERQTCPVRIRPTTRRRRERFLSTSASSTISRMWWARVRTVSSGKFAPLAMTKACLLPDMQAPAHNGLAQLRCTQAVRSKGRHKEDNAL